MVTCTTPVNRSLRQSDSRLWIWPVLALLVLALSTVPMVAQTATGNVAGYVRDTSGAAIPDVTVTAKMVEQQTSRTVRTNSEGFFDLLALPPGKYEITFESKGFQPRFRLLLESLAFESDFILSGRPSQEIGETFRILTTRPT